MKKLQNHAEIRIFLSKNFNANLLPSAVGSERQMSLFSNFLFFIIASNKDEATP